MGIRLQERKGEGEKDMSLRSCKFRRHILLGKATPVAVPLGGKELNVQDRCGGVGTISH